MDQDKYIWLEDVTGSRAQAWVKAEDQRSAQVLEGDGRFSSMQAAALQVLEAPKRLAYPVFRGSDIYNTWQDAEHVHGILRRTSLSSYLTETPEWKTVLDYDALSKDDNQEWVAKGLDCLYPGDTLCMVSLSAGGEDAVTLREFNLKSGEFLDGGFESPRSKQSAAWIDKDSLLVVRDWGADTMTRSSYPFVVKLWKRGTPIGQAKEIYRGQPSDLEVSVATLYDGDGNHITLILHTQSYFVSEKLLWTQAGARKIALPGKSNIDGLVSGQLIVSINQNWTPEGSTREIKQGSVISLDLRAIEENPQDLKPVIVFVPSKVEFAREAVAAKEQLILTTLENVHGRAYVCSFDKGNWSRRRLEIPDDRAVSVMATSLASNYFFLAVQGFLTPTSLLLGDTSTGSLKTVKTLPSQFDSSKDTVEQLEATSKDGTKVPYFVVRPKEMKYDGMNPTVLTAYGGFDISMTPSYSPVIGKLWLERGGIYVLANIRGGGEFGPAWHEAGMTVHRQRIYDDFAAVAQDLVNRGITSPRRLGIIGGSNGGLLMGVEMTQHPDMWNAVVIEVPLLDMLRFEKIDAGASWVGEYGSVSVAAQRAFLASISPYNQLNPTTHYPEPFIFTTAKDDRVGPAHARKFAAKMEEFHLPFLYYESVEGGHGTGANLKEDATTEAMIFTYLTRKLMN